MRDQNLNCRERYEVMIDHHSYTVNSLLTDTSIRRTPGAGPGRFSVIIFYYN